VFEVLSPGTEKDDRGIKLHNYQQLDTMEQILLVSQFAPHVEMWTRVDDGNTWTHTIYSPGETIPLTSVDVEIEMDEIYQNVNFDEPLAEG
jgi:Uma2 family endonuclease